MNAKKIIFVAALVFSACGKDNDATRVRLLGEQMTSAGGAKIWVDPSDMNSANSGEWIENEPINISCNGSATNYPVIKDGSNYYLTGVSTDDMRYAVYPGSTTANGNDVSVTNNGGSGATVTLNRLAVNFRNGGHDIIFPMAAKTAAAADTLRFRHLTGGFRMSLSATSAPTTVQTLHVIVYGDAAAPAVNVAGVDYTTRWAEDRPTLPSGEIGGIVGDYDVNYASSMYFDLKTSGSAGKEINSTPTYLCVPVTLTGVKRITVIGYGGSGDKLFEKSHAFASPVTVARNTIYPIPNIQIN